jgi:biofilm PGA synthesis N-glycosyltransferase PgaC
MSRPSSLPDSAPCAWRQEWVIATTVRAALDVDYPDLEVLVLDDGSSDGTAAAATAAGGGDPRLEVVRDPVNRGKADRLNLGFERARSELVAVTDADTHIHRLALKLLAARLSRSGLVAAVAGAPHVTNRGTLLAAMQVLEAASIIGLIRRTQAVAGRVGVVAGVLGLFRRDAVLAVGGYRQEMITEDIDLSWRLVLAGWHTSYEPNALVGMEVPTRLSSLWAQRRRWARGGAEVLHVHVREMLRWRHRRLWPLGLEAAGSLGWIVLCAVGTVTAVIGIVTAPELDVPFVLLALVWGIAVAVVATMQLSFALQIDFPYDRLAVRAFLLGPLYPLAYWMISAATSLRAGLPALFRGPAKGRIVWDIPREPVSAEPSPDAPRAGKRSISEPRGPHHRSTR